MSSTVALMTPVDDERVGERPNGVRTPRSASLETQVA